MEEEKNRYTGSYLFVCLGTCDTSCLSRGVAARIAAEAEVRVQALPGIGDPFPRAFARQLRDAAKILVVNGCELRCIQDYYFRDLKADFEIFTLARLGIVRGRVAEFPEAAACVLAALRSRLGVTAK